MEQWQMNTLFAVYGWNASPVDGTDIQRSFVAKARNFPFPLEIGEDLELTRIPTQGEDAIQHVELMFPLWKQQLELYKVLNEERRERHRELANKGRKTTTFDVGDIVTIRKQVQSKDGKPAKLTFRTRGPYKVLQRIGDTHEYKVQRIPIIQGMNTKPGVVTKELAMRMNKLPSSIIVHRRIDTLDTKLAARASEFTTNPLEDTLGIFDFGKYTKAQSDQYAFTKVNEMWQINLDEEEEEEEESDDDREDDSEAENNEATTPTEPTSKPKRGQTKAVQINDVKTEQQLRRELYDSLRKSKDKLAFISRREPGKQMADWFIIQVDWDQTNKTKARRNGEYHVKWWIQKEVDSRTKRTKDCIFWPLIKEYNPKTEQLGAIVQFRPEKVDKILEEKHYRYMWYQDTINLAEEMIHGPFDWQGDPLYTVATEHWEALRTRGSDNHIDVGNINRISPLNTSNKRRRKE